MVLFFFTVEYYSIVYMYHISLSINKVKDTNLFFHFLTIVSKAAKKMAEQVSL